MTCQRKKIHSALLLLSSTQMYLIFLRIFSTLFSPWKTKIHLVPHTDFLFLVVFLRRIFFFTFLWETQRKWEKKYSHWFFFTQFHILFFSVTDFLRENITFHSVTHTELFYQEKKNSLRKTKKTNTFSLWEIIFFSLVPTPNKKNNSERNFLYIFFFMRLMRPMKRNCHSSTQRKKQLCSIWKNIESTFFSLMKKVTHPKVKHFLDTFCQKKKIHSAPYGKKPQITRLHIQIKIFSEDIFFFFLWNLHAIFFFYV